MKIHKSRNVGENNPMWKGDDAGYKSLHEWVQNHKPKPSQCEQCRVTTSFLDLANVSGDYKRDLSDYVYLCRKCHMTTDGRINRRDRNGKFTKNTPIPGTDTLITEGEGVTSSMSSSAHNRPIQASKDR